MKSKIFEEMTVEEKLQFLQERLAERRGELKAAKAMKDEVGEEIKAEVAVKRIEKEIEQVRAEDRQGKRQPFLEEIGKGLKELQTDKLSQSQQWGRLLDLYKLGKVVEGLLGVTRVWKRIDLQKVEVLDEAWRNRKLPLLPFFIQSRGGPCEGGMRPDPAHKDQTVVDFLRWDAAVRFERRGLVKILSGDPPIWEEYPQQDLDPPAYAALKAVDLGSPVPGIDGEILKEFAALQKELGEPLRISYFDVSRILAERERVRVWKENEKAKKK